MTAPLPIDIEQVWTALATDPAFTAAIAEAAHPPYRAFVGSTLALLADRLHEPLTFESFVRAKMDVVTHALIDGVVTRVITLWPEDELPFPRQEMIQVQEDALDFLGSRLDQALRRRSVTLEDHILLAAPPVGLNPAALAAYDRGGFTLRDLFLLQPAAFLLMTSD